MVDNMGIINYARPDLYNSTKYREFLYALHGTSDIEPLPRHLLCNNIQDQMQKLMFEVVYDNIPF